MVKYKFEGKTYKIVITDEGDMNQNREQQLYDDFKYCESIFDWQTIQNRIRNGIKYGWLIEMEDTENIEPPTPKGKFW